MSPQKNTQRHSFQPTFSSSLKPRNPFSICIEASSLKWDVTLVLNIIKCYLQGISASKTLPRNLPSPPISPAWMSQIIAQKLLYSESLTLSGMTWQREKKKSFPLENWRRIYKWQHCHSTPIVLWSSELISKSLLQRNMTMYFTQGLCWARDFRIFSLTFLELHRLF